MLKWLSVFSSLTLTLLWMVSFINPSLSQEVKESTMTEDQITTYDGLDWGARDWSYNTKVNIVKNQGDTQAIGWAVLDRHGIDEPVEPLDALLSFLANPFASPNPVRAIFVSTWIARQDGCYMELLVQVAPPPNLSAANLAPYLVPEQVQLKLGDESITLKPESDKVEARASRFPFSYYFYSATLKQYLPSIWYMARNKFSIPLNQKTKFITNAPPGRTNLLVTFRTGKKYVFPIGEGTTKLWPKVYAFNTTCSPHQPTQPISVSQQVFIKPRTGNELPSPQEFQVAEKLTDRYTQNPSYQTTDKLTAEERKQRLAFQKSWSKRNEKVAKFLGAWKRDEESFYVYPSQKVGYTCVVTERKSGEMKFNIGFTYSGNELQYSYKNKRTDSLYWRNTPNYLLVKDFGPGQLRPVFAAKQTPTLPNEMKNQFETSHCPTAFVPPTTARLPIQEAGPMNRLFSLLDILKYL